MSYQQARSDHEYLWVTYGEAYDISGGYVDQDDLAALLKSPTKRTARECYERQIIYWLEVGPQRERSYGHPWADDSRVQEIADRYNGGEFIGRSKSAS